MTVCRVGVSKEHEIPQEEFPMFASKLEDSLPVDPALQSVNNMGYIGPIKALSTKDKQFGRDQFFWCKHSRVCAKDQCRICALDPGIINRQCAVAHTGDEIDELTVAMCLGQPDWIADFTIQTLLIKETEGCR